MCNYEEYQHMHIGYYKDGYDLEVIAYKKIDKPIWDVFIEEYEAGADFLYEYASKHNLGEKFVGYGLKIFSIGDKDATEEQSRLIFEKWLKTNSIV
ncbi:hypothetical protein BK704_08115 [[Bacillus thuringiensis] serovar konkukian]|nr:DUF3986 family protein [Bacillus thuringiensis]MED1302239.1 DUF3986 family protein [Bacillus pacificus]OUB15065.1 hypothetical protein BK704_08115 [[Bacillus thuringiensis] serovar konkukian]